MLLWRQQDEAFRINTGSDWMPASQPIVAVAIGSFRLVLSKSSKSSNEPRRLCSHHETALDSVEIKRRDCPTCGRPRFFLLSQEEWYGFTLVCLRCGDRFGEEGRHQRPFERGWRERSVESAKRIWHTYYEKNKEKFNGRIDWRIPG